MTEILNNLDLGWCALEPAPKIWLWFAAGSRFVMPFRYEAEFSLSEMIAKT